MTMDIKNNLPFIVISKVYSPWKTIWFHTCFIDLLSSMSVNTLRPKQMIQISNLKCQISLQTCFLRVQFTINQHWFRWWCFGVNQTTSNFYTDDGQFDWPVCAALGLEGLNKYYYKNKDTNKHAICELFNGMACHMGDVWKKWMKLIIMNIWFNIVCYRGSYVIPQNL